MTAPASPPFKVVYSGVVKAAIRQLCRRAFAAGRGSEVAAALQAIDTHLRNDARNYGEAKFRYHRLDLEYRVGIETPLFVQFAVHLARPVVFVKKIDVLARHGF